MADFDKSKFDPKAAAEARKQEMEQMAQKLEAGVKDVFQGENYKAYLDFCAKMPRYSINNQILIMMQKPDATMCQSFTGWKEMGRFVKKGEKGIRVMAPAPYKMEREQDKMGADGKPVLDKDGEPVKEVVEVRCIKKMNLIDKSSVGSDDLIYRTVAFVSANFKKPFSLEDMARELGVSKYVVSRIFSKTFHCNFNQYLNDARIGYAIGRLEDTNDTITDIYLDSGFKSQRTFNRVFKERYKSSPSEYRQRRRSGN